MTVIDGFYFGIGFVAAVVLSAFAISIFSAICFLVYTFSDWTRK